MKWICALLLLLCSVTTASATEATESLDSLPFIDSAYIRFVNISREKTEIYGGGLSAKPLEIAAVTDYFKVKQGNQIFTHGAKTSDMTIEVGHYYTAAISDEKVVMVTDAVLEDTAKAMLYFYNFSGQDALTLYAPKYKTPIFEAIQSGTGTSREINPLTLNLGVKQAEQDIAALDPIMLKRTEGQSIFVIGTGTLPKVVVVKNAISADDAAQNH
jgi:Alginate O-acetyl transferase AlgF